MENQKLFIIKLKILNILQRPQWRDMIKLMLLKNLMINQEKQIIVGYKMPILLLKGQIVILVP